VNRHALRAHSGETVTLRMQVAAMLEHELWKNHSRDCKSSFVFRKEMNDELYR
jgi:hypothetical protein